MTNEPNNVNCLNARAIIEYIRRHHPARIIELLDGLPPPIGTLPDREEFLCDENNWMPSGVLVRIFENARLITGDPEIAFSIGFESITHRDLGYAQRLFLTIFASPRGMLRQMRRLNERLNRTKKLELLSDTEQKAVVRWYWYEGVKSSHDVCLYNHGIYSALPTLWGYAPAKVEESPCRFLGGEYCEITINWGVGVGRIRGFLEQIWNRWKRSSEIPARIMENAIRLVEKDKEELARRRGDPHEVSVEVLEDALGLIEKDKEELKTRSDELQHKVEILKAINAATQNLVLSKDTEQVLEQTLEPIIGVLGFDRALIMVEDERREFLRYRHARVGPNEDLELIKRYKIPLSRMENFMVKVYHEGRAAMSQDPYTEGLNPQNPILRQFRPGPSVVCPLNANGRTVGILGVTRWDTTNVLTEDDKEYVQIFANNIATAFERERLDQELTASYEGTVRALVKAIEVNDPYTRGHSMRVAAYAVHIATYLDNDSSLLEDIRFGCILHDVGKLGAASYYEWVKKEPLTNEEYERIKEHPVRGEKILMENEFFMEHHRAIVRSHHERWDGTGYPDHLAGDQIPLEAQIVAVADAYDAMTTDRPYKAKRSPEEAAAEIVRCAGAHFSPNAARAFMQFYQEQIITAKFEIPR